MEKSLGIALGVVGFCAGYAGGTVVTAINRDKLEVVPKCEDARSAGEALVPVPENQITQQIGRTAVCKIDDQVFRLVVAEQR